MKEGGEKERKGRKAKRICTKEMKRRKNGREKNDVRRKEEGRENRKAKEYV